MESFLQLHIHTAKSGDALMDIYQIPGLFVDRPYRYSERELAYFTKEIEGLIHDLE